MQMIPACEPSASAHLLLPQDRCAGLKSEPAPTWPYPTSTPVTWAAPLCSRQSAKPPVDRPESSTLSPVTSTLKWSSAASSLRPALHVQAVAQ